MKSKRINRITLALVSISMCVASFATEHESAEFFGIQSNGPENNAANGIGNFAAAGGYAVGRISMHGEVSRVDSGDFASEKRIQVTAPNALTKIIQPIAGTFGYTNLSVDLSILGPWIGMDPVGNWEFRCYESVDDGGTTSVDGVWTVLRFGFTDEGLPRPDAEDKGSVCDPGKSFTFNLSAGTVKWFKIYVPRSTDIGQFFRINTEGSGILDTEIGLYRDDAIGTQVANDDDDGAGNWSALNFGAAGADGDIGAGTYYIAVGAFNMNFAASEFGVTTTSSATGSITINVTTNMLPLLASGVVTLSNLDGAPTGQIVEFELRRVGEVDPLETHLVTLSATGSFSLTICLGPGNYDISAKGSNWLRKVSSVNLSAGVATGIPFLLINGDADPDNEVNLVDSGAISAAFGSSSGDSNWNSNADLDKDGEVNLVDNAIMAASFGQAGDE